MASSKPELTIDLLKSEAATFAAIESKHPEPALYGVTYGKAVGTYLERKFRAYLAAKYRFAPGNAASGIDLPSLNVDIKATSVNQPQSSCPFKSPRQKIFGLGYSLLVFVYAKTDDPTTKTATLNFNHVIFVESEHTADYQMTTSLQEILKNNGNADDIVALLYDRNLMID